MSVAPLNPISSLRYRVAIGLTFAALCAPAAVMSYQLLNPAGDESLTAGSAAIRGRVVDAQTGRPLRGVFISLFAADSDRLGRVGFTNSDGRYEINDLPAGRYRLMARTEGYLLLNYGQTRPLQGGRPVVLTEKQSAENVDFNLPRGGVIAGSVFDEFGDPAATVQVRVLRPTYEAGRRFLMIDSMITTTNDLGEFRVMGLSPGLFYVAAVRAPTGELSGASFVPTFFPSTTSRAEAQRVSIKLGETMENVTITTRPTRTASLNGTVLDASSRPLSNPTVGWRQIGGDVSGVAIGSVQLDPDGQLRARGLHPGEYELRVVGSAAAPERTSLIARSRFTVSGEDITGLHLTATKMPTGTGRIVLDPRAAAASAPASASFIATPEPYESWGTLIVVSAQRDLTFSFNAPHDRVLLRPSALPRGWYLKAVRVRGIDVTDTGIEFPPESTVSGIEVELTNRPTEVSGTVRGSQEPVDDYTVVVFARDRERRLGNTRYFGTARPDTGGKFAVLGLPAGDYFAIALEYADPVASMDPDFLEPLTKDATAFTLGDGEPKTLDLRLIP